MNQLEGTKSKMERFLQDLATVYPGGPGVSKKQ